MVQDDGMALGVVHWDLYIVWIGMQKSVKIAHGEAMETLPDQVRGPTGGFSPGVSMTVRNWPG